jgi:hypothetical protein
LTLLTGLLTIIVIGFGALPLVLTTVGIFAARAAAVQWGEQV